MENCKKHIPAFNMMDGQLICGVCGIELTKEEVRRLMTETPLGEAGRIHGEVMLAFSDSAKGLLTKEELDHKIEMLQYEYVQVCPEN